MAADLVVIGVASSAGAHHAGQDRAPQASREAGLLDRLRSAGLSVDDRGDMVTEVFAVDHDEPTHRNLAAVVQVARAVAELVADVDAHGSIPLVIGGDCTITIGVVAGLQRRRPHLGLFYFDGDADLATPETTANGVLDAMGVAHLIGLADTELAGLTGQRPILADQRLVLFGCDESDPETFRPAVLDARPHLRHFADHQVRADPAGCAATALSELRQASDGFVLHFDVDAIDSGDLPLANFPHYGTGITLEQAGQALSVAAAAPELAAIVLTEINPSHDPSGDQIRRYVTTVADALTTAIA
ncbi:MAG TPA: arginase family protein [Jiangellales bacterium]|nr:arginase family protein [Jiangellales bacterium]